MHVFTHEGSLPHIDSLPLGRFLPVGDTDSERAFCVLLRTLADLWGGPAPSMELRTAAVSGFAAALRELGPASFLYSDGELLFAHADVRLHDNLPDYNPPGLYSVELRRQRGLGEISAPGIRITPGGVAALTMVASVPLTDHPWTALKRGELLTIGDGRVVSRHPAGRAHAPDPPTEAPRRLSH